MITLDLTKEETFMLRDLTIGMDCGYEWMQEIADSLEEKLVEAKKKPQMRINPDVKSIFDFKFEDFELINYNPHPHIAGKVSV